MRRTGTAGRRKSQENVTTGKLAAVILTTGFIPSTLCEMAGESDGHGPARPWTAELGTPEWGPPSLSLDLATPGVVLGAAAGPSGARWDAGVGAFSWTYRVRTSVGGPPNLHF